MPDEALVRTRKFYEPTHVFIYHDREQDDYAHGKRYHEMVVIAQYFSADVFHLDQGLVFAQKAFYHHRHSAGIDAARTYETAFAAKHAFVHFVVGVLVVPAPHERMHFAKIELGQIACRAGCGAAAASYTCLEFGHFFEGIARNAQIVLVEVDRPWAAYAETEVHYNPFKYFATCCAATAPSFMLSPMFLGAVTVPA